MQVLRAATQLAAEWLDQEVRLGTLAEGKVADLLILYSRRQMIHSPKLLLQIPRLLKGDFADKHRCQCANIMPGGLVIHRPPSPTGGDDQLTTDRPGLL